MVNWIHQNVPPETMPLLAVIFVTEFIYYAVPDVIGLSTQFQLYGNVRQVKSQLLTHSSLDVFCWLCGCVSYIYAVLCRVPSNQHF